MHSLGHAVVSFATSSASSSSPSALRHGLPTILTLTLTGFRHSCRLLSIPTRYYSASSLISMQLRLHWLRPRSSSGFECHAILTPPLSRSLPVLTASSTSLSRRPSLCLLSSLSSTALVPTPSPNSCTHKMESTLLARNYHEHERERERERRRVLRWFYLRARRCKRHAGE
ncbi:hypothetical protein EDB83DRAFT_1838277 [Lactarius deliciosus]|nr:hypothetical protein EDB83DRAFT_1838277 [Lactarius deliciosus]